MLHHDSGPIFLSPPASEFHIWMAPLLVVCVVDRSCRGSREYSEESLKAACGLQERMEADMGGTEILEPLKAIYDKAPMPTHSRQVTNTDRCLFSDDTVIDSQAQAQISHQVLFYSFALCSQNRLFWMRKFWNSLCCNTHFNAIL